MDSANIVQNGPHSAPHHSVSHTLNRTDGHNSAHIYKPTTNQLTFINQLHISSFYIYLKELICVISMTIRATYNQH